MSTRDERLNHVLDAIDGALGDYSVSGDAMRWSPELVPAEEPPGSPLAGRTPYLSYSWLGIRVVEDPDVPPGEVVLVADHELALDESGLPSRILPARRDTQARISMRMDDGERERLLRLIAAAYDVPLCMVDGHRWGPEEVSVGVDGGPRGASSINAYRATCTRCGTIQVSLTPGWVQELRR